MKLNKGLRPPHRGCDCPVCEEYHKTQGNYPINFKPYPAVKYRSLVLGLQLVSKNPDFFTTPDTEIEMGCTRGTVESVRHYLEAFQLIHRKTLFDSIQQTQTCKDKDNLTLTKFGEIILETDPYLESPNSRNLLHYNITTSPMALAFYFMFNAYIPASIQFSRDDATEAFKTWLTERTDKLPSKQIIRNHINTVLRTYAEPETDDFNIEDWVDMLFIDLDLIKRTTPQDTEKKEIFYFNKDRIEDNGNISANTFAYALLSYWDKYAPNANTLDLKKQLWEPGSPLLIFKLNENQFMENIIQLQELTNKRIEHQTSTNLNQLYRKEPIDPNEFLQNEV